MNRFWPLASALLDAISPRRLCEIGAEYGKQTRLMLEYCASSAAFLEVIDPLPRFDVEAWSAEHPGRFRVHRRTSLEALPELEPCDVYFIDGDHNYYTVMRELTLIEERAQPGHEPLLLLHDTGWPYGRRDLYYAPERIPAEHRWPHVRRGMLPGRSELADSGLNASLCNALHEGGPRNGVLTAIEDHISGSVRRYVLVSLDPFHGLTIIASEARVAATPRLAVELERARALGAHGLAERAERERVGAQVGEIVARAEVLELEGRARRRARRMRRAAHRRTG